MVRKNWKYMGAVVMLVSASAFATVKKPAETALSAFAGTPAFYQWDGASSVIGADRSVALRAEDTFVDLAETYGFGYNELIAANPDIDPWIPEEGRMLELPGSFILPDAPRTGIVINVPEYRMYYYRPSDSAVLSFPIGVGRAGFKTPLISTSVTVKLEKPAWYPPRSIREEHRLERNEILPAMVPPGPDNPLGEYAMLLDSDGYLLHGTNKKIGIGMQVSHGCIRLYNDDIQRLIEIAPIGLSVKIVSQPVKATVEGAQVWIEIHPDSSHDLAATGREVSLAIAKAKSTIDSEHYASMDASKIRAEVLNPSGRVVQVGVVLKKSDLAEE